MPYDLESIYNMTGNPVKKKNSFFFDLPIEVMAIAYRLKGILSTDD